MLLFVYHKMPHVINQSTSGTLNDVGFKVALQYPSEARTFSADLTLGLHIKGWAACGYGHRRGRHHMKGKCPQALQNIWHCPVTWYQCGISVAQIVVKNIMSPERQR